MNALTSCSLALAVAAMGSQGASTAERIAFRLDTSRAAIHPGALALNLDGNAPGPRRIPTRSEREQLAAKRKAAKAQRRRNR